jgi:phage protein D
VVTNDRFTPMARIEIDGVDRTRPIWEYLESLTYEDAEAQDSDSLEISVANDPPFDFPPHGSKVRLWMGYKEEALRLMGCFEVDETSLDLVPAVMRIRARSASFSKGTDKEKVDMEWENLSLADLAEKIANKHGYKCKVTLNVYYDAIAQTQESDLHFLKRLAEEANGNFSIKDNTILIFPPNLNSRPKTTLKYTESCRGSFTIADRGKYGMVTAKWWDMTKAEEQSIDVECGTGDATYVIKRRFNSASEAETAAKNKAQLLDRGMIKGELTVPGDATLVAGAEITLEEFMPKAVNGVYLGTKVRQSMSRSGWTTQITLEQMGNSEAEVRRKARCCLSSR